MRWPGSLPGCVPAEPSSPGPRTASTAQWSPQTAPRPSWHPRGTVAWSSSQIPAGQRRKQVATGSVCPDSWSTVRHRPRSRGPSPAVSLKLGRRVKSHLSSWFSRCIFSLMTGSDKKWELGGITLLCRFSHQLVGDRQSPYSVLIWQSNKSGPEITVYTFHHQERRGQQEVYLHMLKGFLALLSERECNFKLALHARILDSVVFRRDMEVGRQEGHQLPTESDLKR